MARLITIALVNLLGNAWKYTGKRPDAQITFGQETRENEAVFLCPRQRRRIRHGICRQTFCAISDDCTWILISKVQGSGWRPVQRIISRHGGRIWVEAAVDQGATFYFTLGETR